MPEVGTPQSIIAQMTGVTVSCHTYGRGKSVGMARGYRQRLSRGYFSSLARQSSTSIVDDSIAGN